MSEATGSAFHYEVEETVDANNYTITTIKCHGKLISSNSPEIRELVGPLIQRGGKIVLDFTDLEYIDSSGLGALVGLEGLRHQSRPVRTGVSEPDSSNQEAARHHESASVVRSVEAGEMPEIRWKMKMGSGPECLAFRSLRPAVGSPWFYRMTALRWPSASTMRPPSPIS